MKCNINIRKGFEYFRYSFDPISIIGRPQDFPQTVYDPCNPNTIYRQGFNNTQINNDENNLQNIQNTSPIISFYPNPVLDKLDIAIENIEMDNENAIQFKFYDFFGRDITSKIIVKHSNSNLSSLNTSFQLPTELPCGLYKCTTIQNGNIVSSFNFSK